MKTLTKEELINDTVAYYSKDVKRRAAGPEGCFYLTHDDRMCAVGRWLKEEIVGKNNIRGNVYTLFDRYPQEEVLKEEVLGHEDEFWGNLQILHDEDTFWDENGLTEDGKEYYNNYIITKWVHE